jgi:hypothetical protein
MGTNSPHGEELLPDTCQQYGIVSHMPAQHCSVCNGDEGNTLTEVWPARSLCLVCHVVEPERLRLNLYGGL